MLYLEIDQHARQITISLRDDSGDVLSARQVSTWTQKILSFFEKLTRERLRDGESFIAVLAKPCQRQAYSSSAIGLPNGRIGIGRPLRSGMLMSRLMPRWR